LDWPTAGNVNPSKRGDCEREKKVAFAGLCLFAEVERGSEERENENGRYFTSQLTDNVCLEEVRSCQSGRKENKNGSKWADWRGGCGAIGSHSKWEKRIAIATTSSLKSSWSYQAQKRTASGKKQKISTPET